MRPVHFREVRGSTLPQVWLHPDGSQAVLLVGGSAAELEGVWTRLQRGAGASDGFDWHDLVDATSDWRQPPAAIALVSARPPEPDSGAARFRIELRGSVHALRLSRAQPRPEPLAELRGGRAQPRSAVVTLPEESWLLLVDEHVGAAALQQAGLGFDDLATSRHDARIRAAASGREFSAIAFPVEEQLSLTRAQWPCDPFVGLQESRVHERRGLRRLADALFADPRFAGFRIVAPPAVVSERSSRAFDALLVSPFGVVPFELKDHDGEVVLTLGASRGRTMRLAGGELCTNPVDTMREVLRRLGDLPALRGLRTEARRVGVVLFTHERAVLRLVRGDATIPAPHRDGDVIVCQPPHVAQQLIALARQHCGSPPRPLLDEQAIIDLADRLLGRLTAAPAALASPLEGMELRGEPLAEESDARRAVHAGSYFGAPVWAKRYPATSLAVGQEHGTTREVQVLLRLAPLRLPGVPLVYGHRHDRDAFWTFVEAGEPRSLERWLRADPTRRERIAVLRQIAALLRAMAALGEPPVVHRALNPRNVRVRPDASVQVVNFDLAQQRNVSTLLSHERRELADVFQADEVASPGAALTPSADVFSLLMIAALCLSPHARPPARMELRSNAASEHYWARLCEQLGLGREHSTLWQRGLGANPARRPSAAEVARAMEAWR